MTREQNSAMWAARWEGLRSSGLKMEEYARREGFDAHSAYRWRRRARQVEEGREPSGPLKKAVTVSKPLAAAVFARVAVSDAMAPSSLLLRVVLTNGRRAELELGSLKNLGDVLDVLERRA